MRILAIGDSTTAGTPGFRSPVEAPPDGTGDVQSQYAYWMMQKHPQWKVFNRGVNGQRSDQISARFEKELDAVRPDAVILLAGVNDLYQGGSVQGVTMNLAKMYAAAQERKLAVVACTVLPYDSATASLRQKILEVNDWVRSYSNQHGLIFCDTFGVVSDPGGAFKLRESPDGLHPSPEVYRSMGEALADVLHSQKK